MPRSAWPAGLHSAPFQSLLLILQSACQSPCGESPETSTHQLAMAVEHGSQIVPVGLMLAFR